MSGRRDVARIELVELLEVLDDSGELTCKTTQLLVGERDGRKLGDMKQQGAIYLRSWHGGRAG